MARRSKPRALRPDEIELWQAVARTVRAAHPPRKEAIIPEVDAAAPAPAASKPDVPPLEIWPAAPLPSFRLGEKARPKPAAKPAAPALQMDAKLHGKMTRGKLAPEARIDLHGLTLAEAHPELIRFVLNAQEAGLRLILVITGKGKQMWEPVPRPIGALRHQVPHWLRLPPLGQAVLQVSEAHLKHGGAGAFYVYLRRR